MKRPQLLTYLSAIILVLLVASCAKISVSRMTDEAIIPIQPRIEASFDEGWLFSLYESGTNDAGMGLEGVGLDDTSWRKLDLPHDWAIEGPFQADQPNNTGKRKYAGIGWYRKHFMVPAEDAAKRIFVDFDGAMAYAKVWLNGQYIGQWPYGYASFRMELTDHVKFGQENIIAVRLENPKDSSRWYPGAGIYRHTRLVKTNPVHVAHWGTYVTTPVIESKSATVQTVTTLDNQSIENAAISVLQEISLLERPGKVVASGSSNPFTMSAGQSVNVTVPLEVKSPKLWDIESPTLYQLKTSVLAGEDVLDVYETTFGIRSIEFDADNGFLLNGKRVQLNGVCMHHDLGPLGAAVYRRGVERQLEIMQEMGCNAIRTSHNPPTPELLEFCDKMGLVVLDEAFDCWERRKTRNGYNRLFKDWHEKDIVALVKRDRNHPCVIMWSSGNEIGEQGTGKTGNDLSQRLTDIFHREDPTRPVTAGCNIPYSMQSGFSKTLDIYGFNYKPHLYEQFKEMYPDQPVYSSESSSCVSSRGEYFFPVKERKDQGFYHFQVSSYDLYAPGWAMKPDLEFIGQDQNPFILGEFVWTGFDYLGEPTPYNNDKTILLNYQTEEEKAKMEAMLEEVGNMTPSRSSYFGIVDLCGFKKDRFYIYQARWRPELPMAHILPHWNWAERVGQVTPVHVYTSGDEAELFLNGKSLGKKRKAEIGPIDKARVYSNLTTGKETEASSHQDDRGNERWKGNDGMLDTRWCGSSDSAEQWWQVDLGSVQAVKSCVIYWEKTSDLYAYQIKVSDDKENWDVVGEANFEGGKGYSVLKFDAEAQYVRIEFTGLKDNTWASFYELQLFDNTDPVIYSTEAKEYYRLRWDDVVYEPGTLNVVAYKDGKAWAEDTVTTTGQAAKLGLTPDRGVIDADGRDLSFVTVEIQDAAGQMVPRTHNELQFSIEGPGEIIATGNGNAIDHTSFQSTTRNAFNGLCLVIVRSVDGQAGTIRLKAESEGLESAEVVIRSR